jgi:hypothetical protein
LKKINHKDAKTRRIYFFALRRFWRFNCCRLSFFRYITRVNRLTKQEQLVLCIVLGLLLTGWAVKTYRTARPPAATIQEAKP